MIQEISAEGVILPSQPLTNVLVVEIVNALKICHFRGVYCRNELPLRANDNECEIINLANSRGDGAGSNALAVQAKIGSWGIVSITLSFELRTAY
jgi:hypothetical protein